VLASGLLKGKGTRRETEGERNRTVTAEGKEPEDAGRRETRGRRTKGKNRRADDGKPEESLKGRPEDVR